jgi:thioredoxin 1
MRTLSTLVISLLIFASCSQNKSVGQIVLAPADFKAKIEALNDEQIVDVRTPEEYQNGFIADAKNINVYNADFKTQISKLDKTKPVFVYCKAGRRSEDAAAKFISLGFTQVYDLKGGMTGWEQQKLPVITSTTAELVNTGMSVEEFNKMVSESSVVLVDFFAPWCGPCKKMAPTIDSLIKVHANNSVNIVNIDVGKNTDLADHFGLKNIPVIKVYKKGILVEEKQGYVSPEELSLMIQNNL